MKLYKLTVVGTEEDFSINYTSTSDFMNYKSFEFEGSEEEKYVHFLEDLKKNGGPQPINIKVKMRTKTVDRALSKNEVLNLKSANDFVNKL